MIEEVIEHTITKKEDGNLDKILWKIMPLSAAGSFNCYAFIGGFMKIELINGTLVLQPDVGDEEPMRKFLKKHKGKKQIPFMVFIKLLKDCPYQDA